MKRTFSGVKEVTKEIFRSKKVKFWPCPRAPTPRASYATDVISTFSGRKPRNKISDHNFSLLHTKII